MEGILCFKIDWANRIVGRKFTVFALFYLVFEGNFQVQAPGGLYLEGRFNRGFFALRVWGAYIWRGLYTEGSIFGILRYHHYIKTRHKDLFFHYNLILNNFRKNASKGARKN